MIGGRFLTIYRSFRPVISAESPWRPTAPAILCPFAIDRRWECGAGGVSTAVQWPTGLGAKGNDGVAATVQQTANSIGYVEYFYAVQNKLTYTGMVNKDGKAVQPTAAGFADAAAHADWHGTPGYGVILANEPGEQTWPMTAATFILVYKKPADPATTAEVLKFFDWAYTNGVKTAEEMIFIPMPAPVVADIKKRWATEITGPDGKPVFSGT